MPIYLRNFYVQQLLKTKKEEQKQMDNAQKGTKSKGVSRPSIPRR